MRYKVRQRRIRRLIAVLLCVSAATWGIYGVSFHQPQALTIIDHFLPSTAMQAGSDQKDAMTDLRINSANAILIRLSDNTVQYEKGSTERIYPASLTKIMTSIIVLENLDNLQQEVFLNKEIFDYTVDASVAGFIPGERVRAIDLLYGLLLPSGAECAVGLANHIAGSEDNFVRLMNDKARDLGMQDTHFTNTTGLHDHQHYSTVKDLSILLQYAIKNDLFCEIFSSSRHSTPSTNKHAGGITYHSTLFSRLENINFKEISLLGGKTGYTPEAGQCLATLAEKNSEKYILVTCGAQGNHRTQTLHIDDALTVYSAIPSSVF